MPTNIAEYEKAFFGENTKDSHFIKRLSMEFIGHSAEVKTRDRIVSK